MKPADLIKTARQLMNTSGSGRPLQSNLRRALSTLYYALFHTLCRQSADLLIGKTKANRSDSAWRKAYRAITHGDAKKACKKQDVTKEFPKGIRDFADEFVKSKDKRELADYDPEFISTRSEVLEDIASTEIVIKNFTEASTKDRRAFIAWIVFPDHRLQGQRSKSYPKSPTKGA